jgi:3-deoxy-7-phosphoheptulonate synthase
MAMAAVAASRGLTASGLETSCSFKSSRLSSSRHSVARRIPIAKALDRTVVRSSDVVKAVHAAEPTKTASAAGENGVAKRWTPDSWRSKTALQQPTYPEPQALEATVKTLENFPPLVFAGEARSLEEKLGDAALGRAFLLQGGDCAESFKEFDANKIRDTFRVLLQMGVVLMFGGQVPVVKVQTPGPSSFLSGNKCTLASIFSCKVIDFFWIMILKLLDQTALLS